MIRRNPTSSLRTGLASQYKRANPALKQEYAKTIQIIKNQMGKLLKDGDLFLQKRYQQLEDQMPWDQLYHLHAELTGEQLDLEDIKYNILTQWQDLAYSLTPSLPVESTKDFEELMSSLDQLKNDVIKR